MSGKMRSRKFRYGSVAVAMTALVVALVIMINAGISALSNKFGFFIDMTSKQFFTLTDECRDLLGENFESTIADRKASNEALPKTNASIAEENLNRIKSSLAIADTNVERAEKNKVIAERNRELLYKSASIAEDNLEIAEDNLALAESLYDYVVEKESSDSENARIVAEAMRLAEKNLKTAEDNIDTAAYNRTKTSGLTPLGKYEDLPVVTSYKYFGVYEKQISDEDSGIADKNIEIAKKNKATVEQNVKIAENNLSIANANMSANAVPGDASYKSPAEFAPYETFYDFSTYSKITGAENLRSFESYLKTETDKKLLDEVKVRILFCNERDALLESTLQRYVVETAEDIAKAFPDIVTVDFVNVFTNPGAVQKYKTSVNSNIYSTNVIIESGTEWRIYSLNAFFVFNDSSSTTPWSYNGEQKMAAAILAVIKAESPIACVTVNHGEAFTDYELLYLLEDAGYIIQTIDLAKNEIPEDCRLMVVYNPTSDFLVKDRVSDISEIAKLNTWLDGFNSLLVFMSPDSPVLPNFEEYLEEWGIKFDRYTDDKNATYPYMIKDSSQSLTSDGLSIVGEYTENGLGASIHKDMRSVPVPPKVIFRNAMSISYADNYNITDYKDEEDETLTYRYGTYYSNGVSRSIYDIFVSSENAVALADGEQVKAANSIDPFKLMTITRESQMISNDDADYSYVIACGSTDFASSDMLQSIVYGNSEVLVSALRAVGRETVVVDLNHKPFDRANIDSITTEQANQYTVMLAAVPAAIVVILGVFVVVRRKYA